MVDLVLKFRNMDMSIERKIRRNALRKKHKHIFSNVDSIWLNDKDFKPFNCVLCGKEVVCVHDSANPFPLGNWTYAVLENEKAVPERCCGSCDILKVLPTRAFFMKTEDGRVKIAREHRRARSNLEKIVNANVGPKEALANFRKNITPNIEKNQMPPIIAIRW